MFENPIGEAGKQEILQPKCSENFRSQIVIRTDIFRKLTLGAPEDFGRNVDGGVWYNWEFSTILNSTC